MCRDDTKQHALYSPALESFAKTYQQWAVLDGRTTRIRVFPTRCFCQTIDLTAAALQDQCTARLANIVKLQWSKIIQCAVAKVLISARGKRLP